MMVDVIRLETVSKMPPAAPVLVVSREIILPRSIFQQHHVGIAQVPSLELFQLDMDLPSMDSLEFLQEAVRSLIMFQIRSSETTMQMNLKQILDNCSWDTISQERLLMVNV